MGHAYLHILLDHYRNVPAEPCHSMKEFRTDLVDQTAVTDLSELFDFTKNYRDFVFVKDAKVVARHAGMGLAKFKQVARKANVGMQTTLDNRESRDGMQGRAIYGVRMTHAGQEILEKKNRARDE